MMNSDSKKSSLIKCEVEDIWHVLGKTWALLILKNLSAKQAIRFNELKKLLSGISATVLSDRLSELEQEGLITKKIYAEVPLRVEYSLTKRARELETILDELSGWAKRWQAPALKQRKSH